MERFFEKRPDVLDLPELDPKYDTSILLRDMA